MIDDHGHIMNDSRVHSVISYLPASAPAYALYSKEEDPKDERQCWRERIHLWAHVRLIEGGEAFVGLTIFDMHNTGHAEHDMPERNFIKYVD